MAGFMVDRLHMIPSEGDSVVEEEHCFTVREADERVVLKVHIERIG
jgi:CBS domain containing-hemolysin-like protein